MKLRLQRIDTGEFLVLGADNTLTIEIHSTLFNAASDFLGSFSYDGVAPLHPNKGILRNAHLISSSADIRTFDVMMFLGSLPYKQMRFNFTIDGDNIKYFLYIDSALLAKRLKSLKLYESVDGSDEQISFATQSDYLAYIMGSTTAAPGTKPVVFFPFKNDGAYKPDDPGISGITYPLNKYFNAWKLTSGVGSFLLDPTSGPYRNSQSPFFYLAYILRRICKGFGLAIEGEWLKSEFANRIVVFSNITMPSFFALPDYTFFMPDVGLSDFLKEVRTRFGLLIDFDLTRKVCTIESFKNIAASADAVDLQDAQLYGIREIRTTLKAYTITAPADDKDTAFSDTEKEEMPLISIGDQSGAADVEEISLISAATKMLAESKPTEAGTGAWRLPWIKMPVVGAIPLDQVGLADFKDRNAFKLRFLYYHGMQTDGGGYQYPYGSADNIGPDNSTPISTNSLAISPSSTAFISVKQFYEFQKNSKPFEVPMLLGLQQFLRLVPRSKIVLKDRNQAAVVCLFDSKVADLADGEQVFAKLTVWPVIPANNTAQVVAIVPPTPPDPPYDNGTVYAKLLAINTTRQDYYMPKPDWHTFKSDVVVYFYADAAGTIPKNVTNLTISLEYSYSQGGVNYSLGHLIRECNGESFELYHQEVIYTNQGGNARNYKFTLDARSNYNVIPTTWMPT